MLIYKSKLRAGTLFTRVSLSIVALLLLLIGVLAAIGMIRAADANLGAMAFVVAFLVIPYFTFRISGWNIREYLIYEDRLEVRILWGIKTISYPVSSLKAFNDLKVLVTNESGGIGIVTNNNQLIKILELEVTDFPEFINNLQKIIKWDLELRYKQGAAIPS